MHLVADWPLACLRHSRRMTRLCNLHFWSFIYKMDSVWCRLPQTSCFRFIRSPSRLCNTTGHWLPLAWRLWVQRFTQRAPNLTPESELCSRICPLTQLHATPALVKNRSYAKGCIFKQYILQRHTLNTHTGATQFSAVLQASNGSSITHFPATANGSQEPAGT